MFVRSLILAAISMASFVAPGVTPDNINQATKEYWCTMQVQSCPLICFQLQTADSKSNDPRRNDCDPSSLTYDCMCDNGATPNATKFSQTIPYFICEEENKQCVEQCDDSSCQSDCREDHPCGAQNPDRVTSMSHRPRPTVTTTSSSSDVVYTGLGGDSQDQGGGGSGAGRLAVEGGRLYGSGIMVAGFLAGFALLI